MTINLEMPKKFATLINQSHQVAAEVFRPISRRYDSANRSQHSYPKELDMLAALIDGMNASGEAAAGARNVRRKEGAGGNVNGGNMSGVLSIMEVCWGDVALVLSMPRQGLGNAAIASVRIGLRRRADDGRSRRRSLRAERREDLCDRRRSL
jgi:acyl-CoA dehydrogenase